MNYPKEVLDASLEVTTIVMEAGVADEWPMVTKEILYEEFGRVFFQKWLSGDEFRMTEDEASDIFKRAVAVGTVNELVEEGYLDTIDADDQELVFLTEKGKKAAKEFNNNLLEGFDYELD